MYKDRVVEKEHTLNPYMDIILRRLCIAGVFVSFGEGVCRANVVVSFSSATQVTTTPLQQQKLQRGQRNVLAK